jgi:hypothetical protein
MPGTFDPPEMPRLDAFDEEFGQDEFVKSPHKRLGDGVNVHASALTIAEAIRRTRPPAVVTGRPSTRLDREAVLRCGGGPDAVEKLLVYRIVRVECHNDRSSPMYFLDAWYCQ